MDLKVINTTTPQHFRFEVTVVNEIISGWVFDDDLNRTELSGRCSLASPSGPEVSFMNFRFIAKAQNGDVEILMGGIGYEQSSSTRIIFEGNFIAVAPTTGGSPSVLAVAIDEGDTGTGNGTQT